MSPLFKTMAAGIPSLAYTGGIMPLHPLRVFFIAWSAALLGASCGSKPDDGATGGADTGMSDGELTTATTSVTPTTAALDSTSTLPDPTGGTSTTVDATSTTGSTVGLSDACRAFCERFPACLPDEAYPLDVCVQQCLLSYQGVCEDAASTLLECAAMLTCDEFDGFINGDPPTACVAELGALEDVCGPGCLMSGLSGPDGCSLGRVCGDQIQDYQCMNGTCTCVANDVPGATCPAAGFCRLDDAAQRQAVIDCCGWDWP